MFQIGENIVLKKTFNNTSLKQEKVTVLSPARLHLTALNPNKMIMEKLGGCGMGLALDFNNIISVEALPSSDNDIIYHSKTAVIKHCLIIMRKLFNSNIHFKVTVKFDENMQEHCGLASNSMLSNAIIYGINCLFRNPLSKEDLIEILDNNFVEEKDGFLVRDICTGIAHSTCSLGGLCIISDNGKLIKKFDFPTNYKVFLIKTNKVNNLTNIKTQENIVDLLRKFDRNTFTKSYMILNELIPALNKNNFDVLFKQNHIFQHFDDYQNILNYYFINDLPTSKVLSNFENIPNSMSGLSTNAKFLYVISSDTKLIEKICIENNLDFNIYSVNNNGVHII